MASMIDILRELVSPTMVSDLARRTGESESAVSSGFRAAIPTIAGAIANRSDDSSLMQNLAGLATRTAADPDPLGDISRFVSSVSAIDTSTPTGGWLSSLFGNNLSGVTDSIARFTGVRGSSASSIISMCAPLVLGYIGRMIRSDNLSVSGLADRLRGQRASIASSVPAGFELPDFVRAPSAAARTLAEETAVGMRREPAGDWAVPALALLGVLALGSLIWWAGHKPVQVARVETGELASKAIGTSGSMIAMLKRSLPGNVDISIPSGGAEDRLSTYLASGTGGHSMIVDRIAFDTGAATLTTDSAQQLDNLATILKAYPKARVTVAGHTDNTGDEAANVALSKARAQAVADRLKAAGVDADRLRAVGYGSSKAMTDNSTETGRAQNRRVTLEVETR